MNWYCSALAFGDFVIDCNFMQYAGPNDSLLAASYLEPLADALGFRSRIKFFNMPINDIPPSVFDVRKGGLSRIIRSAHLLREGLLSSVGKDDVLNVPVEDFRWKVICWPHSVSAIRTKSENIYNAYCKRFGIEPSSLMSIKTQKLSTILIFPDSRQVIRKVPNSTVSLVTSANNDFGISTIVVKIRPPELKVPCASNEISIWGLSALIELIKNADAIVSADSLPAHIAAYYNRPVFVITPVPKASWPQLPPSVLIPGFWSGVSDVLAYKKWLSIQND
jgi:hypothetical protein